MKSIDSCCLCSLPGINLARVGYLPYSEEIVHFWTCDDHLLYIQQGQIVSSYDEVEGTEKCLVRIRMNSEGQQAA